MKRGGIVNAPLSGGLARLGHTDLVVVCDAGLPIPDGPEVVDLAFTLGVPSFETVLRGVLEEIVIEGAVGAEEMHDQNPSLLDDFEGSLPDLRFVPHVEFKRMTERARLVIRTGENTPYANIILQCGVPF